MWHARKDYANTNTTQSKNLMQREMKTRRLLKDLSLQKSEESQHVHMSGRFFTG